MNDLDRLEAVLRAMSASNDAQFIYRGAKRGSPVSCGNRTYTTGFSVEACLVDEDNKDVPFGSVKELLTVSHNICDRPSGPPHAECVAMLLAKSRLLAKQRADAITAAVQS